MGCKVESYLKLYAVKKSILVQTQIFFSYPTPVQKSSNMSIQRHYTWTIDLDNYFSCFQQFKYFCPSVQTKYECHKIP